MVQLSFFAHIPLRCFIEALSHCKQKTPIVSKKLELQAKKLPNTIVSKKLHCKQKASNCKQKRSIVKPLWQLPPSEAKKPSNISRTKNVALGHFCFLLRLGGCGSQGLYNRSKQKRCIRKFLVFSAFCHLGVGGEFGGLSGPVLRDTARLSQRYPPYCALWGFWCLNKASWVRYHLPLF